ncbi:MAG: bifunctional serine/threonine-protein kinase/formylglycine-generating enzyme family protein [Isosphaeraceae bacterium]
MTDRPIPGIVGDCAPRAEFPARYEILAPIGRGGMGEVFLAKQVALGRMVAIKLLSVAVGSSEAGDPAGRFRREAKLLAKANHPHIVQVYDSGHLGDRPYLVMEYVPEDLRAQLRPGRPMAIGQARAILGPIAGALSLLHSLGIVHRDLKPENVLMAGPISPKVADFGIAALVGELRGNPRGGRGLGTPGYVAPEQQYNLPTDERADQYSLAAIAYEMLTGELPLGTLRLPSSLRPSLGPEVDRALLRALQEDPDDRFASIDEFSKALDKALARTPKPWIRRVALATAGMLALSLLGGAALIVRQQGSGLPSRPAGDVSQAAWSDNQEWPALPPVRKLETVDGPVGIKLVRIPPGESWMGADPDDDAAGSLEVPRRRIQLLRPPLVAMHEVTVGQFRSFVEATGWITSAEQHGGVVFDPDRHVPVQSRRFTWKRPTGKAMPGDNFPVTQVSHDDAVAFCDWLTESEQSGSRLRFRLLKECEWEYACRAGSPDRWCFGDDESLLSRYAYYLSQEGNRGEGPLRVGAKLANAFGLHDMHGNVAEWCQDPLVPYSGAAGAREPGSPTSPQRRAIRGGCWTRGGKECRSSARLAYLHTYAHYAIGFRVCAVEP